MSAHQLPYKCRFCDQPLPNRVFCGDDCQKQYQLAVEARTNAPGGDPAEHDEIGGVQDGSGLGSYEDDYEDDKIGGVQDGSDLGSYEDDEWPGLGGYKDDQWPGTVP
jgi:hypothetical protein